MNIGTRRVGLFAFGFALAWTFAFAQARPAAPPQNQAPQDKDYSGMYSFLREGEFIQLTVEDNNHVIGLISRYLNEDPDPRDENGGTFIDQLFKSGKLEGTHLTFLTEDRNEIAYEFRGEIGRGEGKLRSDEAYYVLKGTLTESRTDSSRKIVSRSREVVLKSFPLDLGSPSGKSK
jgi:hypothetical protein